MSHSLNMSQAQASLTATSNEGKERFKSDVRQFGGLLFVLSTAITVGPLTNLVATTPPNGGDQDRMFLFVASLCELVAGTLGMAVGALSLLSDLGHRSLTLSLMIVIQLGWVPLLLGVLDCVFGSMTKVEENPFIPYQAYPQTTSLDVAFVGAMGCLSVVVYAFTALGSVAFLAFAMYAYQCKNAETRAAPYYRGRAYFYHGLVVLGGFSQMALGSYVLGRFGIGPLDRVVATGLYVVRFPEISITVGILQILYGIYGVYRTSSAKVVERDVSFQLFSIIVWVFMLAFQVLLQLGWGDADAEEESADDRRRFVGMAALAPTLACAYLGFAFMPAFLDAKAHGTPEKILPEYYGELELLYDQGDSTRDGADGSTTV